MHLYELAFIVFVGFSLVGVARSDTSRPNILMLNVEGTGPHLGCYGYERAHTPNMDRLEARGYRYEHAFATSGVCAPTRAALVTGMYQTTIGTHHMRSDVSLPEQIEFFSKLLRESGYYCINKEGHDWNMAAPSGSWDENSKDKGFPNRPDKNQPFFSKLMASTSDKPIKHDPKKWGH